MTLGVIINIYFHDYEHLGNKQQLHIGWSLFNNDLIKTIRTHNTNATEPRNGTYKTAPKHKLTEVPKTDGTHLVSIKNLLGFLYMTLFKMK